MKSALTILSVLTAVLCTLCNAFLPWDDPCNIHPTDLELTDEGGEIDVPSACTNGTIWWSYPRGTLAVTFTQTRPFAVCLAPDIGPRLDGIHQVVNGQSVNVDSPREAGERVCLHGNTTVQVLLDAPPLLAYMTMYSFEIQINE